MAKDIEEKRLKKEKKEKKEKRAEADGVTKSKKDKKEKKVKVDAEMVDALEAELEKAPEVSLVKVVDGEDGDEPRGALVPFAFPLADDTKEVKKILKTVKKCMFCCSFELLFSCGAHETNTTSQPQRPRPSVAASRKLSRRSASLRLLHQTRPTRLQLLSSLPTSRQWTSSRTFPFCAKTIVFHTSTSSRARSLVKQAQLSDPRVWS
jgi:hypothetical protein